MDNLNWVHKRSALVECMLQQGVKRIYCEVTDDERDFEWCDSIDKAVIVDTILDDAKGTMFIDDKGLKHKAAQPLLINGHVMPYSQYLKLKHRLIKGTYYE